MHAPLKENEYLIRTLKLDVSNGGDVFCESLLSESKAAPVSVNEVALRYQHRALKEHIQGVV